MGTDRLTIGPYVFSIEPTWPSDYDIIKNFLTENSNIGRIQFNNVDEIDELVNMMKKMEVVSFSFGWCGPKYGVLRYINVEIEKSLNETRYEAIIVIDSVIEIEKQKGVRK